MCCSIDEAGQMSLADVLQCHRQPRNCAAGGPAATRTAHEGKHPEGAERSALSIC